MITAIVAGSLPILILSAAWLVMKLARLVRKWRAS